MKSFYVISATVLFLAAVCVGQTSAPASSPSPSPSPVGHGAFPVKVTKTLDSSKLKQDESVELETAGSFKLPDGTLVPKGSKLEGRVVSAKARSKGDSDSQLALVFNKLDIQGGKLLALKGAVQAVYPPADEPMGPNMATAGTSGGGSARGNGGDATGLTNTRTGMETQTSSSALVVDNKATGVQGVHDLDLDSNGVLTSKGKNVKLGSGVRLVVRVEILG